jgi:hypothetical protein
MLQIDDTIISLDLLDKHFCCNLVACKGICCIEGEEGAPVEMEEIAQIEELLPLLKNRLSTEAQNVITQQGVAYIDREGDLAVSIVNGAECVFATKNANGVWSCLIEQLYNEGKTTFKKPVSCHLYPVRTKKFKDFTAVNYHQWPVCKAAICEGELKSVSLYRFLKEPLIRKFGNEWYQQVEIAAEKIKEVDK